tara:strand:- start:7032 stop:8816 length:1785 start_codon:yes stop_codon:yes gene_type:complete
MSLITDRRDLDFNLIYLLDIESLLSKQKYSSYDYETVSSILDTAQKIAEDIYLPCASEIDKHEPQFVDGKAIAHPAIRKCLSAFAQAGFFAAGFDEDVGGMQIPMVVQTAITGMFSCANLSVNNYSFLTIAAANLIKTFGSLEQKSIFLPRMLAGEWFGTMCLSEPQAGSSLSDIKTKAMLLHNQRYSIQGSKMWISGGDQDISENIIHMVLARTPDAPAGVKGISLFIVPKYQIAENGGIGDSNNISLAGLNHKMGNRGTTNALLNFGESGLCEGWLVGEENHGLRYMFQMMNEARIGVGHGAAMQGLAGYLYSLEYARMRPQGRSPEQKDPSSPQVSIIQHADVKRLLLAQKSAVEGALSLSFYCACLIDEIETSEDEQTAVDKSMLLDLLTPIAKSWPSEFCLEANKHAIQILGGYGYTTEYPVERMYRDNRLNHIHEGTHAIHGLDVLGRKVRLCDGKALSLLAAEVEATLNLAKANDEFLAEAAQLEKALMGLVDVTSRLIDNEDISKVLANATLYLDTIGHIVIGWLWLKKAILAAALLKSDTGDAFLVGKITCMRYFYRYELAKVAQYFELLGRLDTTFLYMDDAQF